MKIIIVPPPQSGRKELKRKKYTYIVFKVHGRPIGVFAMTIMIMITMRMASSLICY